MYTYIYICVYISMDYTRILQTDLAKSISILGLIRLSDRAILHMCQRPGDTIHESCHTIHESCHT